jgi:opacity protein-like surface antigen
MKKVTLGLLSLVIAATAAMAAVVVQETDEVVGYDGSCQVYFRPDLGFFEACERQEPVVLGVDFDTINFHRGFRFREGFTRERIHAMHRPDVFKHQEGMKWKKWEKP